MFDILSRLYVGLSLKKIGRDLLNKYDAVMEKVVDNEELMERMRGNSAIYVRSSKDFKFLEKKKCIERNNFCTGNRYSIRTKGKCYQN